MNFDGVPFSVDKVSVLDCQYGVQYWKEKKEKENIKKRLKLQGSRKIGCHAHIRTHTYTLYPDFQLSPEESQGLSKRKLRQLKEEKLRAAREAIATGGAKTEHKHFVSLPTEQAHEGHPVGQAASFCQRIHPIILSKISELVSSGIDETKEVQKVLNHYVKHTLPNEHNIRPIPTDRAFYPLPNDIKNHVGNAKRALELSKLDQENLRLKIEEWQKDCPESTHYFRPYVKKPQDQSPPLPQSSVLNSEHTPGMFLGTTGCEEDWVNFKGTSAECSQTLLWVHQNNWQKELLVKYGNTITLIDATYKTTKYDLALFFLCVKTNVNYTVVAEFIVQSESADEIANALKIIKQWNPDWTPPFFMSDYSEAEQLAIMEVFPECTLYLCDFHREQAWERWVRDHHHRLSRDEGDELLHLLRECAHAPAPRPQENLPHDHYYNLALNNLKSSSIWLSNEHVRTWLKNYWLNISNVSQVYLILHV